MNCNTTHYRANSSSVPGDPTFPRAWRQNLFALLGGALACLGALAVVPPTPVAAAALHVTSCADDGGAGTLRGRIVSPTPPATIVFDQDCTVTLTAANGTLTPTKDVTIDGSGHTVVVDGGCTVSGGQCQSGGVGVFRVNNGVTASISNLTIQHGSTGGSGGGGGILNNGTLFVMNSTISSNNSPFGGGIDNNGGRLTVTNSTLIGNRAIVRGGGIENIASGTLFVVNSTLTDNGASTAGGGIDNSGSLTLQSTIVAGNMTSSTGPDVSGAVTGTNSSLIGATSGSTGIANGTNGDIVSPNPLLGALGSNGGTTQTVPVLAGSPAIAHGHPGVCASTTVPAGAPIAGKDQRGLPRPAATCAIGAFEPQQATYTVGATGDIGPMETFTLCQSATNTTCKLRDALAYASSGSDTVQFNSTGRGTIVLTNNPTHGTLTLAASVSVVGPTSGTGVAVDGGSGVRVFQVNVGVTASLSNLTIQHGNSAGSDGGGIHNDGTLTVTNSTITANSASDVDANGGGIWNGGTLTVTNSTLSGNSATGGGGILKLGNTGTVAVTNSTITGNSTGGGGGGGIRNLGTATVTMTNTIVAGNTATGTGPDLTGAITSGGHNLIGSTSGTTITLGTGNLVNPNPLLGTLGSNGGTTQTVPVLAGSPAAAHGEPAICANPNGTALVAGKDQRGVTRPAALCAIGAFEPLLSATAPSSGSVAGGATVTLTGAGFAAGAAVSIGGAACTNVQIVNSTTLRCTTGAHAAAAADVVATVGSATGTLTGGYTYGTAASLPGQAPSAAPQGGPNPQPGARPAGTTGGPAPNPQPVARP